LRQVAATKPRAEWSRDGAGSVKARRVAGMPVQESYT
jgi:hypothetical protein